MKVLFVCTGNICRSPMAEALLRRAASVRGQGVVVLSAGITFDGREASEGSVVAMNRRGIDISRHRSRIMWAELVRSADLVVGMARSHVREATVLAPTRFDHIYTLKELVRRGSEVGERRDQPLDTWLKEVAGNRVPADLLRDDAIDDIEDPVGRRQSAYDKAATEIEQLIRQLSNLLWGPVPVEPDVARP